MASEQPPRQRRRLPPAKLHAPTPTSIFDLGPDLILEIFLRLPSLPSLVRAALACCSFLAAVRSSPTFRRRFRELHPAPLLGFFFESSGTDIPSFTPIRRRHDPDLTAAVRGADILLTRLPYHEDSCTGWEIADCHGGCLLLLNCSLDQIAAYNPLTRALDLLPMMPDENSDGRRGKFHYMNTFLVSDDESPRSFRVVSACHNKRRVRPSIYSSGRREWEVLRCSRPAPAQPSGKKKWLLHGTQATGNLFFPHAKLAYMVVLDTDKLQFSFMDLPEDLKGHGAFYKIGETQDGKLCMVSVMGFTLCIWFRTAGADGVEKWMVDHVISLEHEILQAIESSTDDPDEFLLKVWAVLEGTVYMSPLPRDDHESPIWFLSFCLKTRKLDKLFNKTIDNCVYPYIMAWPPSLVGNTLQVINEV